MKKLTELTNEELWKLFPIIITEHKDYWKENYACEAKRLIDTIGKICIARINHIGSTAIPDLPAKPTIDILLEIKEETDIRRLIEQLESVEYIYSYQPAKPAPHMMFMKGYTPQGFKDQTYHLHVRYHDNWDELYFRDYLIKYPDIAQEYGNLKLKLKEKFEYDRDAYTSAKTDFIKYITELAKQEFSYKYKIG